MYKSQSRCSGYTIPIVKSSARISVHIKVEIIYRFDKADAADLKKIIGAVALRIESAAEILNPFLFSEETE